MRDTMRDLITKIELAMFETALRDKEDLLAKRKALQDLQAIPSSSDPEIKAAIMQRKADLEKEAQAKGFAESGDDFDSIEFRRGGKSPEDLGGADAWYHRPYNPSYYGFENGSPEAAEYAKGYHDADEGPSGGKQWD